MADIPDFDGDVDIIAALSDLPNATDGLTAAQLKAKFDLAAGLIKTFINGTMVPQIANKTTADLTYYVRTDGSDSNDGLSDTAGGAFLTIGKAISMIPQVVNHAIVINVAAGTYAEDLTIIGFVGEGSVRVEGAGDTTDISSITIKNCTVQVHLTSMELTSTTTQAACYINMCVYVSISAITITSASSQYGVHYLRSRGYIEFSTLSNRGAGIACTNTSDVLSFVNTGSGNTYGIRVERSTFNLASTQPSGTTAQYNLGGTIR